VAVANEQVIGVRVFLRWEWWASGRRYRAVRAVDTATHPDWGRRGIFQRMTLDMIDRLAAEGIDFIFNTPNQYSMPGYLKMGWTHVGRLPLRLRAQRPARLLGAALRRKSVGGASEMTAHADNTGVNESLKDAAVRRFLERVEDRSGAQLRTAKNLSYLEWRYGRNRWYGYRIAFDERGESAALAICRPSRRGDFNELLVSELLTTPDRAGRRLGSRVVRALAEQSAADYVAVSGLEADLSSWLGFVPVGQRGPDLTVRPLRPDLAVDPRTMGSWGASLGDLELF
jgi:GNAT superfamily N-acetyltransferase